MAAALRLHRDDDPAPPPEAWEPRVIELLARLDHLAGSLDGLRAGADAAAVLDRAEALVHAADDLAGRTPFPERLAGLQAEAVGAGGVFQTAALAARGRLGGVWASLTGRRPAGLAAEVRAALLLAADALQAYFALFARAFPDAGAARGWVDAASTFLADARRRARDLAD